MQRMVVSGAGGFLGVNVVLALARAGHTVWACDVALPEKRVVQAWEGAGSPIHFLQLDVRERSDWTRLPDAVDAIIHAAAVTSGEGDEDPGLTTAVNVGGTVQALEWTRQSSAKRFVYVSSSAVYRGVESALPLREDMPLSPTTVYGRSKWASEGFVTVYREQMGVSACSVRLPSLYGPWERPNRYRPQSSPIYQLLEQSLSYGSVRVADQGGIGQRDYTYVGSAAQGLLHIATIADPPFLANLSSGRLVGFSELKQCWPYVIGGQLEEVDLADEPDVVLTPTSGLQPMDTTVMETAGYRISLPLEEGLQRTVKWFRQYHSC